VAIKDFTEKEIRHSIKKKVHPKVFRGRNDHEKGYIYIDGVLITKVKIPNEHDRIMRSSKSKWIAEALMLEDNDFNELVDCSLTGPEYYKKLKERDVSNLNSQR
jgi:hypothetical protein